MNKRFPSGFAYLIHVNFSIYGRAYKEVTKVRVLKVGPSKLYYAVEYDDRKKIGVEKCYATREEAESAVNTAGEKLAATLEAGAVVLRGQVKFIDRTGDMQRMIRSVRDMSEEEKQKLREALDG